MSGAERRIVSRQKPILDCCRFGGGAGKLGLATEVARNVDYIVLGEMLPESLACSLVTIPIARNEFNSKASLARDTLDPGLYPFVIPSCISHGQLAIGAEVIELHFIPFRVDLGHGFAMRREVIVRYGFP